MRKKLVVSAVMFLFLLVSVSAVLAAERTKMVGAEKNILLSPDKLVWKDGPASLPGTKMAVLEGNPGKRGFFVTRLKLPAGTKIPPHIHSQRERVTVISGKLNLAMGEKPENPVELPAGSYFSLTPKTVHNAWVDEDTVLQVSTNGPWTLKEVGKETKKKCPKVKE